MFYVRNFNFTIYSTQHYSLQNNCHYFCIGVSWTEGFMYFAYLSLESEAFHLIYTAITFPIDFNKIEGDEFGLNTQSRHWNQNCIFLFSFCMYYRRPLTKHNDYSWYLVRDEKNWFKTLHYKGHQNCIIPRSFYNKKT